jgi:histidinol-phosphate phosphatase family protein
MSQRAVFLDRDNTIIENDGYLGDPSKVKLLPGAATALASLRTLGYRLIVVSNQSGVARGMFKESDVQAVNDEMSRQLRKQAGAFIDASYYCPFHPDAPVPEYRIDHDWRKPKPGMLKQAAADFNLDLAQCWMIGDQWRDVAAGTAAGCRTILLRDPSIKAGGGAEAEKMNGTVSPSFVVRTLSDAARIIVREGRHAPPPTPSSPASAPATAPTIESPAPATPPAPPPMDPSAIAQQVAEKLAAQMATLTIHAAPSVAPTVAATSASSPPASSTKNAAPTTPTPASPTLEQRLDELIVYLRQQNRNADLQSDFSLRHIAALVVQVLALFSFAIGFFKYMTMNVTYHAGENLAAQDFLNTQAHLQALIWIVFATFLQGLVVALLLYARQK